MEVQGQRLNSTKEERITRMYGPDRRLDLIVLPEQARLQVIPYVICVIYRGNIICDIWNI